MVTACACMCGSSDALIRSRIKKFDRRVALGVSVPKGKEKCYRFLDTLPQFPEIQDMKSHIRNNSKWAIVIGYDSERMRWVDLANGTFVKNDVDLELLLKHFA